MNSSPSKIKSEIKLKEDPKTTKYYIDTNDIIMNEIQELLTDQDMIKKKLIEQDEYHYTLELIFPKEITQTSTDIKFLLLVSKEHPNFEPELYCLTVFSHPHICDGRNLINNIINGEWSNKRYPLESIVNKIPKFIVKYIDTNNDSNIVGKYILNKIYKIKFLKKLPIFFHLITNENKILIISDISICIFLLEKNIGFCKLSLYVDIKNIIQVNPNPKKNIIIITYKISLNKKNKSLTINTANVETINAILKEKLKINLKKGGKLPDIDINAIEKEIKEKEKEQKDNDINLEKKIYLMSLYQKAIEYYSAINNPKFIEITHKIHKLLENTQLNTISKDSKLDKNAEEKLNKDINNNNKKDDVDKEIIENNNLNSNAKDNTIIKTENNKNIENNPIKEVQNERETKIEDKTVINNDIGNNKKEEEKLENKKEIKKTEEKKEENAEAKNEIEAKIIKTEEKKEDIKDEKINVKENVQNDKDEKKIDKKDDLKIPQENKNDEKISQNKESKDNKDKEKKEDKATKVSLRLKIDENELGTLDVGDEEEEEEEDEK